MTSFPVLCGYMLRDIWCTTGAVMVHVTRLEDVPMEFKLQMEEKFKLGWFGRWHPRGWDLLWYRTMDYPNG